MAQRQSTKATLLSLATALLLLLSTQVVDAKVTTCKTKFSKGNTAEYCTKFGTGMHEKMGYNFNTRIINFQSVTPSDSQENVKLQLAVYSDQQYDEAFKGEKTCDQKRKLATKLQTIVVPTDGTWSKDYAHDANSYKGKISSTARPRLYYFEILDCEKSVGQTFRSGNLPRFTTKVHITTEKGNNEFSYEDQGLLRLYGILFVLLGSLFLLLIRAFYKFFKLEGKWMAPHPIMIYALAAQMTAIFFQYMHLYGYSTNGEGYTVCDVLSKIAQGFSEVTISLLLIMMASGWKLRFQELDFDDQLEIYLPMAALVLMVQIILCALTFVDMDASHKYHDFAGVQGWCLVFLKSVLFIYFAYCIYDSQQQTKRTDHKAYIKSLGMVGASYLLAIPVSIFVSFCFEPFERQYVFTLVSEMAMFAANTTMLYMLSSSKSTYRKTSLDDAGLPHTM